MAERVGLDLDNVRKAEMWSALSWPHVEIILNQQSTLQKWVKLSNDRKGGCDDELFIPTILHNHVNSSSEFQSCSLFGTPGLNTCCSTATVWSGSTTRVPEKKHMAIPVDYLSDDHHGGWGAHPVHFQSLREEGLIALQTQGYLLLRKVMANTVVKSMSNETLDLSDALFQLYNRKPMVPRGNSSWKAKRKDYYFQCMAPGSSG